MKKIQAYDIVYHFHVRNIYAPDSPQEAHAGPFDVVMTGDGLNVREAFSEAVKRLLAAGYDVTKILEDFSAASIPLQTDHNFRVSIRVKEGKNEPS